MDSPWKTLLGKANPHDWPNIHQPFPVHAPGEYRLTLLLEYAVWAGLYVAGGADYDVFGRLVSGLGRAPPRSNAFASCSGVVLGIRRSFPRCTMEGWSGTGTRGAWRIGVGILEISS